MKDVALRLGVTTTTVHRALHNKEGVSDETRLRIRRTAAEMGYRQNYMAAALKRKDLRIAVAIPDAAGDNSYYYGNLWAGVRRFLGETTGPDLIPLEYSYPLQLAAHGHVLKEIYQTHTDRLDGVLTMAMQGDATSFFLDKFAEKNIPVVLIGNDIYREKRLCCVKTDDEMAGCLAAELMTAFSDNDAAKNIMVLGHFGQLGMQDQLINISNFETQISRTAPRTSITRLHSDPAFSDIRGELGTILGQKDFHAIYSSSARYTIYMTDVVKALGLAHKIRLIGSDSFPESLQLLQEGVLTAIVDKKIANLSYIGMKTLFDYIVKGAYPPGTVVQVNPEVVLRSNVRRKQ
ncbi:MAG: substrate-binding domain-containing protein [Oscillospiraceae bacterium]|jgi:LacI family transcriptional regulator|nr:substrate-binding domain-containing protein [Oscillospiraceae bacterium]